MTDGENLVLEPSDAKLHFSKSKWKSDETFSFFCWFHTEQAERGLAGRDAASWCDSTCSFVASQETLFTPEQQTSGLGSSTWL